MNFALIMFLLLVVMPFGPDAYFTLSRHSNDGS